MEKLILVSVTLTLFVFSFTILPVESCLTRWFLFNTQPDTVEIKEDINRTLSIAVLKVFQLVIENETQINFTCPGSNGYFPHKFDCQLYYFCENSNFTVKSCEKSFGFDNKSLKCIPKGKVKLCQILERNTDAEIRCGFPNGLQPHPTDCRKFILCIRGMAYSSSCINDEYFDSKNNVCIPLKNHTDCVDSLLRRREDGNT